MGLESSDFKHDNKELKGSPIANWPGQNHYEGTGAFLRTRDFRVVRNKKLSSYRSYIDCIK